MIHKFVLYFISYFVFRLLKISGPNLPPVPPGKKNKEKLFPLIQEIARVDLGVYIHRRDVVDVRRQDKKQRKSPILVQ